MRILAPTAEAIQEAAKALRQGLLVGMPTETVYGLAANALDPKAVQATFTAKGRPADNPLIVHLADASWLPRVAREVPEAARQLAERFWPGPLTLVLPKRPEIPDIVTGGLDTLGVRVPAHPVARALIQAADVPVSAPSANPFMRLSPTRVDAIDFTLSSHLALVLDGGPCEVGIESTVVDLSTPEPCLLRPGGVSREALEDTLGRALEIVKTKERRSPGTYLRHYAPRTPIRLSDRLYSQEAGITFQEPAGKHQIRLPSNPSEYAQALYGSLHTLDEAGYDELVIESPPHEPGWEAVWDRLRRASNSG